MERERGMREQGSRPLASLGKMFQQDLGQPSEQYPLPPKENEGKKARHLPF
jgi:hypothetical protein